MVKNPDSMDPHILRSYLDKITRLEEELQGLSNDIFYIEGIGELVRRATLFDVRVAILCK